MGESGVGWGERAAPGARTAGRTRDATEPRSPAGGGGEHERRKERAAKTRCSQLRSPLPSPPPSPAGPTPSAPARLRNLPPAPTTIVPAHLTPSREDAGGGDAAAGGIRRGRGTGRTRVGKVGPRHLRGRGGGEEGRRGCRRGGSRRGGGGARRDAETGTLATQELLRRETKGWRGGGGGERRRDQTRSEWRIKRVRAAGRMAGERGGLEAGRTGRQGYGDLKEDEKQMGRGLR